MLNSIYSTYSFHDTILSKIEISHNALVLHFEDGIFYLDADKNKKSRTNACKLFIRFAYFNLNNLYQHVEIKKYRKHIYREISFDYLLNLLQDFKCKVYLDYYCFIARAIKLEGSIKNFDISITITDIDSLSIVEEKSDNNL